jgi:hypothetical protein
VLEQMLGERDQQPVTTQHAAPNACWRCFQFVTPAGNGDQAKWEPHLSNRAGPTTRTFAKALQSVKGGSYTAVSRRRRRRCCC